VRDQFRKCLCPAARAIAQNLGHGNLGVVVDDALRLGITTLLLPESDLRLVGEASNGREAIAKFRECNPDITLMDLQMPEMSGFDAIVAIRDEFPGARVIVLTMYAGDAQAQRAIKAGAQGYLLKNLLHKELLQTVRAVHAGRKAVAVEVAVLLAEHTGEDGLTLKEIEVLRRIASGNANKEIAAQLNITEETVKSRVKNILDKLAANDRTHAVTIGLKRGIIDL
jgi:DNA-binding NarL/FixJ family response regulator